MDERDFLDREFETGDWPESDTGPHIRWDWFVALTAGWIVFECFAQPALSVVVAAIRFGWNDFANAWWLWRRDPDIRRGRACAVMYSASGFWRITVTTFLVMTAVGVVAIFAEIEAPGRNLKQLEAAAAMQRASLIVIAAAFVTSSVMTWLGMFLSWRAGLKLWLDGSVRISRRIEEWPPRPGGLNLLATVVTASLLFAIVTVVGVSIAITVSAFAPGQGGPGWVVLAALTAMICAAFLILSIRDRILRSHLAGSPAECWASECGGR